MHRLPWQSLGWLALSVALASCSYSGPYVVTTQTVILEHRAGPSQVTYRASVTGGGYGHASIRGRATTKLRAEGSLSDLDGKELGPVALHDRAFLEAAPPHRATLLLESPEAKVEPGLGLGLELELEFVRGSWEKYTAGEEVELQLTERGRSSWNEGRQAELAGLMARQRELVSRRVREDEGQVGPIEMGGIVREGEILVRANRAEIRIDSGPEEMDCAFTVRVATPDPNYREDWSCHWNWPSFAARASLELLVFSGRILAEHGVRCLGHCLRACLR